MNKIIFWISIIILSSPWFLVLLQNRDLPKPSINKPILQYVIDDTNTLRGEASETKVKTISKIFVNKYFLVARYYVYQYISVYDPHYLFFSAAPDPNTNPIFSGPLYLSLLVPLLFGIYLAWKKKKVLLLLLLITAIYPSLFDNPHETITRVPFFITISSITALGMITLRRKHKKTYYLVLFTLFYEFLRFAHNFSVHYPRLLAEYWYKLK